MGLQSMNAKAPIQVTTRSAVGPAVRERRRAPEFVSVSERAPETSIRRLEAMLVEAGSQLRGTQVGLMKLRGEISDAQHSACVWFAELHAKYLRAIDAKTVKTGSAEMSPKAEPPDPYSEVGQARAKKERKDVAEFESARLSAMACGSIEYAAFVRVVIDDTVPIYFAKKAVREIGEALRRHRQASSKRRRGRRTD